MKELAAIAYPNTPKEIVKQYANDYFVKGLYDEKLKTQLALSASTDDTKCLLAEAIDIQNKLVSIAETDNDVSTIIQHIQANNSFTTQTYKLNESNGYSNNLRSNENRTPLNMNQQQNYQQQNYQQQNFRYNKENDYPTTHHRIKNTTYYSNARFPSQQSNINHSQSFARPQQFKNTYSSNSLNQPTATLATLLALKHPFYSKHAHQITGECQINNHITTFLADTGSSNTVIHKSLLNMHDNEYGKMRNLRSKVLTADGKQANIIGVKTCKIMIGNWVVVTEVLVSNNLISKCIIGLDVLSIFPPTKQLISDFHSIINQCTLSLRRNIVAEQNQSKQKKIIKQSIQERFLVKKHSYDSKKSKQEFRILNHKLDDSIKNNKKFRNDDKKYDAKAHVNGDIVTSVGSRLHFEKKQS